MNGTIQKVTSRLLGLCVAFALVACGGINTSKAASDSPTTEDRPVSALIERPLAPNRAPDESLPQICNCVLRFDHISIEQGLSQSSVRAIFQDSRGFLWFGTEDGLNRYDGYTFKSYKPEPSNPKSISSGWINAIAEDKDGYLWIGTSLGGLNRYDPLKGEFTQYQHIEAEPTSITDNHISALFVDQDNGLWVGTLNGLDRFEPETGSFHHYPYMEVQPKTGEENVNSPDAQTIISNIRYYPSSTQSNKLSSKNVSTIYQDSSGRLWIGTSDGGLNRFDEEAGTFTIYQNMEDKPFTGVNKSTTISSNRVTSIVEDLQGDLWIGTNNGLNRFDPQTAIFQLFMNDENDPGSLVSNAINTLYADRTGNLWIGTSNGLDRLPETRDGFIHYNHDPSFSKSLSTNQIVSIYEDRGGVLWFGTYAGGVNKYDRARAKFAYYRHDLNDLNSLSGNVIFPIYVDQQGFAWIGTDREGLNHFNWRTGENTRFMHDPDNPNSLGSNSLISIFEDSKGMIWLGTWQSLDRYDPNLKTFTHFTHDESNLDSISSNRVYAIHEDGNGQLWFGTSVGLDRFDRETNVFTHYRSEPDNDVTLSGSKVTAIHEDDKGNLWVGTAESGLNRFDPRTETFTHFRHHPRDQKSISSDSIQSIYQDTQGRLWIGTAGGGLNLYHPETNDFTFYLEKDGLPNGFVYGILEDDQGHLWMSTNFGISRFDPETKAFRNFNADDGLQSNEFDSYAYAKGRDGEFYFGGINGLTVFHPSNITDNPYVPQVTLTSLTQDDQPIALDTSVETAREVTLEWPQNSLEFEFAALSYNQPNKNHYAYMLEGFDTNWHFIGTKRSGRYTNLPGGKYTLLLKATNSDGVWTETPAQLNVIVIPPYWQTVWFRALLSVAIVTVILGGVKLRTKSIQDRNRALER
ncbi:MAG TPA: two-component regulator propeller domain-containing protein, partial [Anaerolineales bacterium]|nr:two-component regulator propeller domain-containing protein [Anaerolineales bacterium]